MDNDIRIDYDAQYGEPMILHFRGEQYEYHEDRFLIDVSEVKKMELSKIPKNIKIQPIFEKEDEDVVVLKTETDFSIMRTNEGMVILVDKALSSKHWYHPYVSLSLYVNTKTDEVEENDEFQLNVYENTRDERFILEFSVTLYNTEDIKEVLKLAKSSLSTLEKRTKWKMLEKIRDWVESETKQELYG